MSVHNIELSPNNIGGVLRSAREAADLGLRELARRAGTSHATLSAYEKDRKTPSVATFLRIIEACSYSVDMAFNPRIRQHNGLDRADELAQVLELAEQFPSKPLKKLAFPRFERQQ